MNASSFPDPAVDYRQHPEDYRIGRGEQGVLTVQPYKAELLPLWRFKTPIDAAESAHALLLRFETYKAQSDFVGMDMARKFLQMGYTRSRRYARHRSGRKYADGESRTELPLDPDLEKAQSAQIFYEVLEQVRRDAIYISLKAQHQQRVKAAQHHQSNGNT